MRRIGLVTLRHNIAISSSSSFTTLRHQLGVKSLKNWKVDTQHVTSLSGMKTRVVKIGSERLGRFQGGDGVQHRLERWTVDTASSADLESLRAAAKYIQENDTPIAFPTETVYGLGADARRSAAVKGIYQAKGRPSDNPLIVHVCDLEMLRGLLVPEDQQEAPGKEGGEEDPIPAVYKPLIERFWPGPLTILLPLPGERSSQQQQGRRQRQRLAPEVTAGLGTFGARMPDQALALTLMRLADAPLAAPSANASTRPSPTTAAHVLEDLDGRIETILDGGPCGVGVESTVVDGLCDPPAVLRPGGVGLDELRACPGWDKVVKAYRDRGEEEEEAREGGMGRKTAAPRAPGMKYKHYSPRAKVVLYESSFELGRGAPRVLEEDVKSFLTAEENGTGVGRTTNGSGDGGKKSVGFIRTQRWPRGGGLRCDNATQSKKALGEDPAPSEESSIDGDYEVYEGYLMSEGGKPLGNMLDIDLGQDIRQIAHGIFSALRDLDRRGADIIFVDGIDDKIDIAGAVMNRLRKAATEIRA